VLSVSKRTPRILLNTDEYPECVETTPRVFGPVTEVPTKTLTMRAELDQGKDQDHLPEVVPRFLPFGVCVHRPIGNTSENGTWKPLPTRDDGSVLQTHPYGFASDYNRICRRGGIL
jgi:hypothetical protein